MIELVVDQVHYQYPKAKKETLRGVDAVFPAGKTSSIVGQSGAGKSTLLYLISGLDVCTSGRILLNGKELLARDLDSYRRNTVATISQSYLLFPTRTVLENVLYPLQLAKTEKQAAVAEATKHLRNEDTGTLTLDSLLVNPAFEGIGTGRPSFLLQGGSIAPPLL